jgi:parvulin-like peptidyl-prolyl isomerase
MIIQALSLGCAALLLAAPVFATSVEEKIEARVDDAILTTGDLDRMLAPLFSQYDLSMRGPELALRMEQTREAAIESWIENQLILQEAQDLEGFQLDPMEVERMFEEERGRFESTEDFDRALALEGITEREFKKTLEERYKVRALTYQKVTGLISISPRRVMEYYREHESDYREEEMARISLILIPSGETPAKREAARELADSLLAELESGADFADLARLHSAGPRAEEGGDFGLITKGDWKTQLDEAAFRLEVGEYSGLIEADEGYYILYCAGKKEAALQPLEEVYEEIEDKLFRQEYERRYRAWIEDLRSRAHVVVGD